MKAEHVGGEADFPRENNFNFLRFALAVLVLFSHSFSLIHGGDRWDWLYILTRGQVFGGGLAVDGFFIISGSLILQSWLRSLSAGDYLRKRALRIYPGYLVCALLCIFVVGPIASGGASIFFHTMPWRRSLAALPFLGYLPLAPFTHLPYFFVNGVLWTISAEFICYLMVAALGLAAIYRRPRIVLALATVVWALYNAQALLNWKCGFHLPLYLGGPSIEWLRLMTFFLAGMCYYLYREKITCNGRFLWLSVLALTISCITNSLSLTLPIFGTYLLFYFAFHPKIHLHRFGRKTDLSYGIYLYAWPIQQLLLKYFFSALNPITLFLCALPLSCAAAYLSWTLVEKPFLKLKPRPQTTAFS